MRDVLEILRAVSESLEDRADELNRLDAEAGDGDLGVTASNAACALEKVLSSFDGHELSELLQRCGIAIAKEAPSTAGTLLASGLVRAGRVAGETYASGALTLAALLDASREAIADRGKAELGAKTMLDALAPAAKAAADVAGAGGSVSDALDGAALAADEGAKATATMIPRFGRASWLPGRSAGHEDAGARLVAMILESAATTRRSQTETK